ncbi:hypothetical protein BDV96DRAFT_568346 [Lophiotrema nucula]|uniref:Zn(2)-C6 fungal-type domain-containing protein n=1 Tax=Lophiotrema nucula TaxID=690887 RepID=A0A6A5ZJT3_9PLEO|nr:hypothetical protein BDV96DRAFT_568346 [Lophiotrema nucula]
MLPSGQRRPHRKSRTGCQQCKQRKIKCDEQKPICSHCRRNQFNCSLSGTLSISSSASDVRATPSESPQLSGLSIDTRSASKPSEVSISASQISFLEIKNLELLHFYTTTTSLTLSNRPELQRIWQQVVPQIAFTHGFLLHGILAFSALHLARSQPERKTLLYMEASVHHDVGVKGFRIAMSDIAPENFDACLAFSTIVAAYAWASSDRAGDLFFSDTLASEEQSNVEWASLLRGVFTLLDAAGEWMSSSALKMILHPPPMTPTPAEVMDPKLGIKLTALSQLWDLSPENFSVDEMEALSTTLALLREECELVMSSNDDHLIDIVSIVYGWPIKVPAAFLAMVQELRPEALIVLAHYSLLLNKAESVWFMQGMSRRLLQTIHKKIGKEWESWIAWPLQDLVLAEFKA